MKTRLFYFFLIFLLMSGAGRLMAQIETTASISGQVTDDQGPLAGATVVALHQPSGSSYSTTARGDGRYNLPNLRIGGPYIVKVTFVGYHVAQQELTKLALGQNYTVNLRLSPNSATLQEVVVSGKQSKIINSGRTGASQNISRTQIQNLPTQNRSFVDFVKLTPQFSLQYNNPSFAGRSNLANNFTVDGALFNNAFGLQGTIGSQTNSQPINMDAFEEISVNIAPYDIRQSGFTGAAINAVTRSGTNEFQGSLNYYTRSQNLVSKKIYTGVKSPVGNFDLKGYGFTAGGPIIKNKLFFFLSGELERRTDPGTAFIASRNGSSGPNVANVKGEDLDALSTYLQSLGYQPGPYEGYSLDQNSDKFSVKLDYNINAKNTLTAKYFYFRSYKDILPSNSGAPGGSRQPSRNALPFQSAGYGINNNMDNVNLELRTRFSSKLSNQLTLGYNAMKDFRESKGNKPFPLVDIKNPAGSTYTSFGYEPFTAFNKLNTDVFQITDNVSLYTGKHEFTFGGNFEHYKTLNGFAPNYYGAYVFNSLEDFYKSARDGASNAASYNVQYSVLPGGAFPYAKLRTNLLGLYVQDSYSVNDNLKITAGLRADLPMIKVMDEQKNENVANLTFANGEKLDVSRFPKTSILWSPRVGFNYNVNGEGTTQLRGGTGIFSGRPPLVWLSNQASNNGVQFGADSFKEPVKSPPFNPNVDAYRNVNNSTAANNTSYSLAVTVKDFKFPQIWRSNLAVDQVLPGGITGTFEALYAKDLNAVYLRNANLNTAAYTALPGADNRPRFTSPKIYGASPATPANPNINDAIVMDNTSKGHSLSLTGTLQKEFRSGFFAMMGYTYTDSRSVNDGGSIAQSMWRDRYVAGDPNSEALSYSSYMVKNRFIASVAYRKEYLKHLGTTISLFYQLQDGGRYSYAYSGDLNNDGQNVNDLIYIPRTEGDIKLVANSATDTRTSSQIWTQLDSYINQDRYLSTRRGKYAERNGLVAPMIGTLDLRIAQDVFVKAAGKRNQLQFTLDVFNFGNMINREWGVAKAPNRTGLLSYKGLDATGKPTFSFPMVDEANGIPLTSTFYNQVDENSRWRIQIGLRYRLNQ